MHARRTEGVRTGDTIDIDGGYQHRALTEGFAVQRFWHRLKTVTIERIAPPEPGMAVLDLGCGSGVVANWLAERAQSVDAVDANPRAIDYARRTFARPNLSFHLATADALPFPEGRFDRIYVLEFIEHLYWGQLAALFSELRALLAPGGTVFLTTPNYRSPWPLLEGAMDRFGLAPHAAPSALSRGCERLHGRTTRPVRWRRSVRRRRVVAAGRSPRPRRAPPRLAARLPPLCALEEAVSVDLSVVVPVFAGADLIGPGIALLKEDYLSLSLTILNVALPRGLASSFPNSAREMRSS